MELTEETQRREREQEARKGKEGHEVKGKGKGKGKGIGAYKGYDKGKGFGYGKSYEKGKGKGKDKKGWIAAMDARNFEFLEQHNVPQHYRRASPPRRSIDPPQEWFPGRGVFKGK
jgi:hypothetical protein